MDFVVVDVETANRERAICQVGVVDYKDSCIAESWQSLVNPEVEFERFNVELHGIDETAVKDAPTFHEIAGELSSRLSGKIVVSHGHYDRLAFDKAAKKYRLSQIDCRWLDSLLVARRAWPEWKEQGHSLKVLAKLLAIELRHHDALEDARAAGEVILHAQKKTGVAVLEWLDRVRCRSKSSSSSPSVSKVWAEANPEGPLFGEVIVFTGTLELLTPNGERKVLTQPEAEQCAAAVGCVPKGSITKETTMVVFGKQDERKFRPGQKISTKQEAVEEKILKGQPIQILTVADFFQLIEFND